MIALLWEKTGPIRLALVDLAAGGLVDEIWMDVEVFQILYRLNYFIFTSCNVSAMLSWCYVVMYFSLLFSNKAYWITWKKRHLSEINSGPSVIISMHPLFRHINQLLAIYSLIVAFWYLHKKQFTNNIQ